MDYEENQKTTKLLDYLEASFTLEALKDCESESILSYNFIKSRVPLERFFHCVLLIWNLHSFNQLAGIVIVLINIFHIIFINRYIGSAS